jgi:hypothetical protein
MSIKKPCAYCGYPSDKRDKEHVFPKSLYPLSKANSKIQRLTIPACNKCNNSWADDEAHFRNILVVAGDPTSPARKELWESTVDRSFDLVDGFKRMNDLLLQMKPIKHEEQDRHMVFPGNDQKVVRVCKKIVRGLCYHHNIEWPISEERVFVDVLKFEFPKKLLGEMEYHHRDQDIVEYRFKVVNAENIQSAWLITFFKTVTFIGLVSMYDSWN